MEAHNRCITILHPHFLKPGGASKVVLEFACGLSRRGLSNTILTTGLAQKAVADYPGLDIKVIGGPVTGSIFHWLFFPIFYRKLSRTLRQIDPRVLFCNSLSIYWGAAYKVFNPDTVCVYYLHDLGMPYTDSVKEIGGLPFLYRLIAKVVLPIFGLINNQVIKRADYIIANSQTSDAFLRKRYQRKADTIINPGVDISIFTPSEHKQHYIYTVGRLEPIKRTDLVIKAFARYLERYSADYRLVIIGDGPEKDNLIVLAESLGVDSMVEFRGTLKTSQVARIAREARAGVFLCPNESFGLAVVESISAGAPAIVINQGGAAEIVVHGQTGLHTDDNPDNIAKALNNLLQNQQKLDQFAGAGRQRACDLYSWDYAVSKLAGFLSGIRERS